MNKVTKITILAISIAILLLIGYFFLPKNKQNVQLLAMGLMIAPHAHVQEAFLLLTQCCSK